MDLIEIILLALIQGLTEFLPISSSAHLILPSQILGCTDQGLGYDVAVHVGSLLAVMIYFREEVTRMFVAWLVTIQGAFNATKQTVEQTSAEQNFDGKLAWWILFATIPAGLFGFFGKDYIEAYSRSIVVIAATTLIFGVLLGFADIKAKQNTSLEKLGFKGAMLIGLAQAIAVIPGTSRSGITMTMGLMLGLNRDNAARFSFLLSIPAIAMAGSYYTYKFISEAEPVNWSEMGLGAVLSFVSAYACIHLFLKLINKVGMMPFVIYRLVLGVVLLGVAFG